MKNDKKPEKSERKVSKNRSAAFKGDIITTEKDLKRKKPEFEVEKILKKKITNGVPYYLVKWKGFPNDEKTWEPKENLQNAPKKLIQFEKEKLDGLHNKNDNKRKSSQQREEDGEINPSNSSEKKKGKQDSLKSLNGKRAREKFYQEENSKTESNKRNRKLVKLRMKMEEENQSNEELEVEQIEKKSLRKKIHLEADKAIEKVTTASHYEGQIQKTFSYITKDAKLLEILQKYKPEKEDESLSRADVPKKSQQVWKRDKKGKFMKVKPTLTDINLKTEVSISNLNINSQLHEESKNQNHQNEIQEESFFGQKHETEASTTLFHVLNPSTVKEEETHEMDFSQFIETIPEQRFLISSMKNDQTENIQENLSFTSLEPLQTEKSIQILEDSPLTQNVRAEKGESRIRSATPFESSAPLIADSFDLIVRKAQEVGSLEDGDIPIQVLGARPIQEKRDLELLVCWKNRKNGVQPVNSKVMRLDLLKNRFWSPLIEFYESKMKLLNNSTFNPAVLAKYSMKKM